MCTKVLSAADGIEPSAIQLRVQRLAADLFANAAKMFLNKKKI